jgi:hypothetical protein
LAGVRVRHQTDDQGRQTGAGPNNQVQNNDDLLFSPQPGPEMADPLPPQ